MNWQNGLIPTLEYWDRVLGRKRGPKPVNLSPVGGTDRRNGGIAANNKWLRAKLRKR